MLLSSRRNLLHSRSPLGLVCEDSDEPARRAAEILLQQMLRRGSGYGIAGPTWREGKRQRQAARPRDVKVAACKLVKRLEKHAAGDPGLSRIAAELRGCNRRHRCLDPACPQCGRAIQRLFVRALVRFLRDSKNLGPWVMLSVILPPLDPGGEIDFAVERARYTAVLQRAGLTLGAFGLDLSFNEDDRRVLPEAERFTPHPCVHLYGIAPAAQVEAALPALKRLAPTTKVIRRPIRRKRFNGNPAGLAYCHKPRFARRLTILQNKQGRANPVRTTRDRLLTVEQELRAVRSLDRAGLTGRMVLLDLRFATDNAGRLRLTPST